LFCRRCNKYEFKPVIKKYNFNVLTLAAMAHRAEGQCLFEGHTLNSNNNNNNNNNDSNKSKAIFVTDSGSL
jgi:hypothetical protein